MDSSSLSGFDDQPTWGVISPQSGDLVRDALRKEKVIQYVLIASCLPCIVLNRGFREITLAQEDLRGSSFDLSQMDPLTDDILGTL
jgi:hypothetical protein